MNWGSTTLNASWKLRLRPTVSLARAGRGPFKKSDRGIRPPDARKGRPNDPPARDSDFSHQFLEDSLGGQPGPALHGLAGAGSKHLQFPRGPGR